MNRQSALTRLSDVAVNDVFPLARYLVRRTRQVADDLARRTLGPDFEERTARIRARYDAMGGDPFGLDPDFTKYASMGIGRVSSALLSHDRSRWCTTCPRARAPHLESLRAASDRRIDHRHGHADGRRPSAGRTRDGRKVGANPAVHLDALQSHRSGRRRAGELRSAARARRTHPRVSRGNTRHLEAVHSALPARGLRTGFHAARHRNEISDRAGGGHRRGRAVHQRRQPRLARQGARRAGFADRSADSRARRDVPPSRRSITCTSASRCTSKEIRTTTIPSSRRRRGSSDRRFRA